jgi:hypothetical protein
VVKLPVHRMCCILLGACTPNGRRPLVSQLARERGGSKGLGCVHSCAGSSSAAVVPARCQRQIAKGRSVRLAAACPTLRKQLSHHLSRQASLYWATDRIRTKMVRNCSWMSALRCGTCMSPQTRTSCTSREFSDARHLSHAMATMTVCQKPRVARLCGRAQCAIPHLSVRHFEICRQQKELKMATTACNSGTAVLLRSSPLQGTAICLRNGVQMDGRKKTKRHGPKALFWALLLPPALDEPRSSASCSGSISYRPSGAFSLLLLLRTENTAVKVSAVCCNFSLPA